MSQETIQFEIADGVATLTLNRPDSLNSFNTRMHAEVREALKTVRAEASIRCLLLTGAGRGFCAGQDLSDRSVAPGEQMPDLGASIENHYNPMIRSLTGLEKPVLCAVNGVAAGAGANIALACDIVLAARSASFVQAFCRLGLIPDSGGTWSLVKAIGLPRAKGLALLGEKLSAEQAADWGLIWRCVDDAELMDEARRLARHLATQPTRGLAAIKRALLLACAADLDTQLDTERDLQRAAGRSEDYREGVAAFLEKRRPEFTGR